MKSTQVIIAVVIIMASFPSCTNLLLKAGGITTSTASLMYMTNGEKNIMFIPMHHVGTEPFYTEVSTLVDSLRTSGYKVFYESTAPDVKEASEQIMYRQKLRKLIGVSASNYLDVDNQKLIGRFRYTGKEKLINQPPYTALGVDTALAVKADVPINRLIDLYEEEHNEVSLDSCDLHTPLDAPYLCYEKKISFSSSFMKNYVREYRDLHLLKTVLESEHDKILIIYGRLHMNTLYNSLQSKDNRWRKEKIR